MSIDAFSIYAIESYNGLCPNVWNKIGPSSGLCSVVVRCLAVGYILIHNVY